MFIREILFIKQAPSKQPLFIFYCGKRLSKSVSAKAVTLGYQGFFFFFSFLLLFFTKSHTIKMRFAGLKEVIGNFE